MSDATGHFFENVTPSELDAAIPLAMESLHTSPRVAPTVQYAFELDWARSLLLGKEPDYTPLSHADKIQAQMVLGSLGNAVRAMRGRRLRSVRQFGDLD